MDNLPNWIQAVTAVVALIITIISLIQTKRIKELTGVINELQNQTGELSKQTYHLSSQAEGIQKLYELYTKNYQLLTAPKIIYHSCYLNTYGTLQSLTFKLNEHDATITKIEVISGMFSLQPPADLLLGNSYFTLTVENFNEDRYLNDQTKEIIFYLSKSNGESYKQKAYLSTNAFGDYNVYIYSPEPYQS